MYYPNRLTVPRCTVNKSQNIKLEMLFLPSRSSSGGFLLENQAKVQNNEAEKYHSVPFPLLVEFVDTQYGITAVTVTKEPKK